MHDREGLPFETCPEKVGFPGDMFWGREDSLRGDNWWHVRVHSKKIVCSNLYEP